MNADSTTPPAQGSGARYAILGVLLLMGSCGLYWLMNDGDDNVEPEIVEAPADAGTPTRAPQFEPEFEIPEEEDAGEDTGVEETEPAHMRPAGMRAPRDCNGDISREALARVISQHRPQVRSCYERRLKVNNILQGVVNVNLIIGRTGNVERVAVGGSLRDSEVFSCVRRLAQSWDFPAVEGGSCAQVSVPFRLTPRP